MAPFSKDRGRSRGGGRGVSRGSLRGRGRGRGRGDHTAKVGPKRVFYSTRLEEQAEDGAEDDELLVSPELENHDEASVSSSGSDDDIESNKIQPYKSLLQSLRPTFERGEPQHKKPRLGDDYTKTEKQGLGAHDPDHVDEAEEVEDSGTDDLEADDLVQGGDPFLKHLDPKDEELNGKIKALQQSKFLIRKSKLQPGWSVISKASDCPYSTSDTNPDSASISGVGSLRLKQRLTEAAKRNLPSFDKVTGSLAFSIFNYQDILFPMRTKKNGASLRNITCLHVLNHVFKTRDRVIKGNARLAREDTEADIELRDQGFTRPKILILLSTRNACLEYVQTLISLCEPEQQENKKRFQESFAVGQPASSNKPEDFRELFDGNDDDMFRLGLKFTRKTIKFFAQFYNSDIIFASPLGLRLALSADDPKKQDTDFLSSIEVLIMDKAESMLMQNWEHIEYIFEHLNLQPKEAHGCDFSRVRNWYLDGNAKYLRQTILFSAFNFPSLNKLYSHRILNLAGSLKYSMEVAGAMTNLSISLKQTFSRLDYGSPATEPQNRFKYFITTIIPSLTKDFKQAGAGGQGVLVYLPLYADFVRVRKYLADSSSTQNISFGSISEYTSVQDVARARSHFLSGRHSVLLYTERAHHFRRYHLKGVKRVIMYGLPENPIFYEEITGGYLGASVAAAKLDEREASVRVLFSRLDAMKLERIVGTKRHLSMLKERGGDTFDFV